MLDQAPVLLVPRTRPEAAGDDEIRAGVEHLAELQDVGRGLMLPLGW